MKYADFEVLMSAPRMKRYEKACKGDTRKALTLYRHNLTLSQEMFTVLSCFEVVMRNKIDRHFVELIGDNWLKKGASKNGFFDNKACYLTMKNINQAIRSLGKASSHNRLVAELGFGFWRYMFAAHQFRATGKTLLQILPCKPTSSKRIQYNNIYIFNELASLN